MMVVIADHLWVVTLAIALVWGAAASFIAWALIPQSLQPCQAGGEAMSAEAGE